MLEHSLPKGSDFRVGASTGDFLAVQLLRLPAEALDPDKRITADDDWHLEQCKAEQEKSQVTEIGDACLKTGILIGLSSQTK